MLNAARVRLFVFAVFFLPLSCFSDNGSGAPGGKAFAIYAFIPWQFHVEQGTPVKSPPLPEYLERLGILRVNVVYDKYYLDDEENPDEGKIKSLAEKMAATPEQPVSFDTEFGNRSLPNTVIPRVLKVIEIFRRYNSKNPVGVYATAPQNTYGWRNNSLIYDALNPAYAPVAEKVDFLSPVLYNYTGKDLEKWKKSAQYNMDAAKAYRTGKPIIPYISPTHYPPKLPKEFNSPVNVEHLTEEEMRERIRFLRESGASGCIVWASSRERDLSGKPVVFDAESGWGKALVQFARDRR